MTGRGRDRDHGRLVSTGRVSRWMVGPPLGRGVHRLEEGEGRKGGREREREGGREGGREEEREGERDVYMYVRISYKIYIVHTQYLHHSCDA